MFHSQKLDSGLRLITAPVAGTNAVTILILVGAGSRYEQLPERGIAHFLEHMFFKGGKVYNTPRKVSRTIDAIGGEFNAFTGKEYAGYYVKCAGKDKRVAFDVLSDMLLSTKLDREDIDRERGVIIEELNMYQDTPIYQIGWDFEQLMYGDSPMGRDQIGLPETINAFTQADFHAYRRDLYTADNTVIIVSGDISAAESQQLTSKYFAFDSKAKQRKPDRFQQFNDAKRVTVRDKKTEQAHLIIGYPGVPFQHQDDMACRLLSVILGGNMSSRMFTSVREEKGLCYSISTSTDHYSDSGIISTHAGVDLKRTDDAIRAMLEQYRLMREQGPSDEEILEAKSFLRGRMTLRLEDSEELASFFGVQAILNADKIRSLEELMAEIESVDRDQVARVARELLLPEACRLAAIGPFSGREAGFAELLATDK